MIRSTLGLIALAIGLIGLVLPLIPGIPFLILAWLLLRRGDRHWRRPYGLADRYPTHEPRGYEHAQRDEMSTGERLQLRALQATSGVLKHLDRAERRVRGQELSGPR